MQELKLAQFCNNSHSIKTANELLEKVHVDYCIPDKLSDGQHLNDRSGYTSLHFAVVRRNVNLIIKLIERGADLVKQGTRDGCTPLLAAIDSLIRCYIPLYERSGQLSKDSIVHILLSKQVKLGNILNPKSKTGMSHLHVACMVNHARAVKFFVTAKIPLNQPTNCDMHGVAGYTPLHFAIKYSSVQAADILLQHGADLHVKNAENMSCVHLLMERIMDISDFITMGKRTLCTQYLEEIGRLKSIIKLVLKNRASREIFIDETGLSALHIACTLNDKSIVKDLLKQDVDINIQVKSESRSWSGWTPLHFAACCNIEVMMLLMQNGADILIEDSRGETPLDLCAKRFTPADLQMLLSKKNEFKDIMLSDNSTKLSDLLLAMNDCERLSNFLRNLEDINLTVPFSSPIWPGYNLLHLCVYFSEKTRCRRDFEAKFGSLETTEAALERYNCTKQEEALYLKRIKVCLKYGCSVIMKNAKEQSPIHLAFDTMRKTAVKKLLKCSEEDVIDQGDLSYFHIACILGNLDLVKRYLSEGVDVDCPVRIGLGWSKKGNVTINFRKNSTPLHLAVLFNHVALIEYLLECKADVHAKDSLDFTPYHLSTSPYVAKLIFRMNPKLRDSVSKIGLSHLHVAAYADDRKAVEQLLSEGAEVDRVVDANAEGFPILARFAGKTPLHLALQSLQHSGGAVDALLRGGANANAKDLKGIPALQYSMHRVGDASTKYFVRMLKSGKCDAEPSGTTLLHAACQSYDIEWAKKLLEKGLDVDALIRSEGKLQGATPLYVLINNAAGRSSDIRRRSFLNLVELLANGGADVTVECRGSTPLHRVYEKVYDDFDLEANDGVAVEEMRYLLDAADVLLKSQKSYRVNPKNSQGFSHFHLACVINDVESATKFLDNGVDVNESTGPWASDYTGAFTALHFASAHRSGEIAHLLLERGADVNAEDSNGNTPLHVAIKRKFVDSPFIEAMISRGADIHAKNLEGETMLSCLLSCSGLTLERLESFLIYNCDLNIMGTSRSIQGIIGLAMRNSASAERLSILKRLMQIPEIKSAMQNGHNFIRDIVAIDENRELTVDDYLNAIQFLMDLGCDIDQQNTDGYTAIHTAVDLFNFEATDALLQLGVDVNVVDNENQCPFPDDEWISLVRDTPDADVVEALTYHLWKMRFSRLDISDLNLICLKKGEKLMSFASLEQSCQDEWAKAKETEICQGLTVRDFLSETGAVAAYPRFFPIRRDVVDKFFQRTDDLHREFPEFCGLLAYQYRKALVRMKLWKPAKKAIAAICQVALPDLCFEAILSFFTNREIKVAIEVAPQLWNDI